MSRRDPYGTRSLLDYWHAAWWAVFVKAPWRLWQLRWKLPVLVKRERKHALLWKQDYAWKTMRDVLNDLETRGDEVSARARLYTALTTVNWE